MRYVRTAGGLSVKGKGVSNVRMEELSRDLAATVLLKLTISSDSHHTVYETPAF